MDDEQKALIQIDGDTSGLSSALESTLRDMENALKRANKLEETLAKNDAERNKSLEKGSIYTKQHAEALQRLNSISSNDLRNLSEKARLQQAYSTALEKTEAVERRVADLHKQRTNAGTRIDDINERLKGTRGSARFSVLAERKSAQQEQKRLTKELEDATKASAKFKDTLNEVSSMVTVMNTNKPAGPNNIKYKSQYGAQVHRTTDSTADTLDRLSLADNRRQMSTQYGLTNRNLSDIGRSAQGAIETLENSRESGEYVTGKRYQSARRTLEAAREALYGKDENGNDRRDNLNNTAQRQNDAKQIRLDSINAQKKIQSALNGDNSRAGEYANMNEDYLQNELGKHREQVKLLDEELKALNKQQAQLDKLKSRYEELGESLSQTNYVAPNRQENPMKYAMYTNPGRFIAGGVGAPLATLGMFAKSGMGVIDADRQYTRNIGSANGTYNSNPIRRSAETAGQRYGFSGQQMLQAQASYLEGAGYQGSDDLNQAGIRSNLFARLNGASLDEGNALTSTYANNVNNADSQSMKAFQQTFYGAIKQAGLDKYGKSQLTALTSLASTVAGNNGGVLTQGQMQNLALTQTALASTGEKSLMGQNGAQTLATLDNKLRGASSDSATQFLMMAGNPSEFNGTAKGYANILKASQDGISNPRSLQAMMDGWQNTYGQTLSNSGLSQDDQDAYLGQFLGVNRKTAGAVRRVSSKKGFDNLTTSQYKSQLQQAGLTEEEANKVTQQSSDDASSDKASANVEKASTQIGEFANTIKNTTLGLVGANSTLLLFTAAVASAATSLGGLALNAKAGQLVKDYASSSVSGIGKSTSTASKVAGGAGTLSKSGGVLMNTFGGKVAEGGRMARTLSTVDRGINATVGTASKIGNAVTATKIGGAVVNGASKVGGTLAKGVGMFGKLAPGLSLLGNALDIGTNVTNMFDPKATAQSRNSGRGGMVGMGIGGTIGGLIGSVVPGAGTVVGASIGASLGNIVGNGIGGLFKGKNSSTTSNESALADKRLQAEKLRQQNIKNDDAVVDKWGRVKSPFETFKGGTTKTKSADSSTSPFEASSGSAEGGKKGKGSTSDVNIVVSGTIKHEGKVDTAEDLSASISGDTGIPANLFSILGANETARH